VLQELLDVTVDTNTQIREHRAGVQAGWLKISAIAGPIVTALGVWWNMRGDK
jgi:hypothetical protein